MILRTPQEWADFLGMKVVCFAISKNTYAYYAINLQDYPFSYAWIKYLDEILKSDQPNDFYKKACWGLTEILNKHKYNSVFMYKKDGNIKMLIPLDPAHNNHKFIRGVLKNIDIAYKLPMEQLTEWDKNVYVPSWETE
jgi:hypothetical protein